MRTESNIFWNVYPMLAILTFALLVSIAAESILLSVYSTQPEDEIPTFRYNEFVNYADSVAKNYEGKSCTIPQLKDVEVTIETNAYNGSNDENLRYIVTIDDKKYNFIVSITYPLKHDLKGNIIIGIDYKTIKTTTNNISSFTIIISLITVSLLAFLTIFMWIYIIKKSKS